MLLGQDTHILESYADCNFLLFVFPLLDLSYVLSLTPFFFSHRFCAELLIYYVFQRGFIF